MVVIPIVSIAMGGERSVGQFKPIRSSQFGDVAERVPRWRSPGTDRARVMQRFILWRVAQSLGVLVVLGLVVFALARVTGNPADLLLPEDATRDARHLSAWSIVH
jgi:hypothetical protein